MGLMLKGKLKTNIKREWLKRLRSGDYLQGKSFLCQVGPEGEHLFCCLGVLADFAVEDEWESKGSMFLCGRGSGLLDDKWIPYEIQNDLASMNDSGDSFDEIADYIEETL